MSDFAPKMDPNREYNEINTYVVSWGLLFVVVFALAIGFLALKIGQTIGAETPVSVLAMGMGMMFKRKDAFAETVQMQSISSASTNILGAAIFILPAFYILNMQDMVSWWEMIIPMILGGAMGVCVAVIFRQYFCVDMHDQYRFPSSRATAEILMSNEGARAKLMLLCGLAGIVYDFVLNTFGAWQEVLRSTVTGWGQALAQNSKIYIGVDSDAALLGLGYFTGLRYAAIIGAGAFFSWFLLVPVIYYFGGAYPMVVGGKHMLLANVPIKEVFNQYVRLIGIGMLAMAGIIGLLKMMGVVYSVIKEAVVTMTHADLVKKESGRVNRDMPMNVIVGIMLVAILIFTIFFHIMYAETVLQSVIVLFYWLCFLFSCLLWGLVQSLLLGMNRSLA